LDIHLATIFNEYRNSQMVVEAPKKKVLRRGGKMILAHQNQSKG
jgi:hypothetical protein